MGSCITQWPFVGETIFTSATQNGFINSIRGWHFPHPHAWLENQWFPLEEYCSPHLSLPLCWQLTYNYTHTHTHTHARTHTRTHAHTPTHTHTYIGSLCFPPCTSGTSRICGDSAQPLFNKPVLWRMFPYGHIPTWLSVFQILLQHCKLQRSLTCYCYSKAATSHDV